MLQIYREACKILSLPRHVLVMQGRLPAHARLTGFSKTRRWFHGVTLACGCLLQAGNESVLRARFEDAQFFFQEDLKRPLSDFRPQLAGITFHKSLGTMLDKSVGQERLVAQAMC